MIANSCDPISFTALWHQVVQGLVIGVCLNIGMIVTLTLYSAIVRKVREAMQKPSIIKH